MVSENRHPSSSSNHSIEVDYGNFTVFPTSVQEPADNPKAAILDLEDQAETELVSSLEDKRHRKEKSQGSRDGFRPAVPGERPPMHSEEATLQTVFGLENTAPDIKQSNSKESTSSDKKRVSLGDLAKKVIAMKKGASVRHLEGHKRVATMLASMDEDVNPLIAATAAQATLSPGAASSVAASESKVSPVPPQPITHHRRQSTTIRSDNPPISASHRPDNSIQLNEFQGIALTDDQDLHDMHKVFGAHHPSEQVMMGMSQLSAMSFDGKSQSMSLPEQRKDSQVSVQDGVNMKDPIEETHESEVNRDSDSASSQILWLEQHRKLTPQQRRQQLWQKWKEYNPWALLTWFLGIIFFHSMFPVAVLLTALAWVLYEFGKNPELDFLPGNGTIAWWFLNIARWLVTFELARATQWIVIDCIALSSKLTVRSLGPFMTLSLIQSKGWPFISSAWGIWNLILLYGDDKFQLHWLYWTDFDIFTRVNSGMDILGSEEYLRILLSMLFAGIATAAKRTLVGIYFGRKTFTEYKPKLEAILNDIIVISELAELTVELRRTISAIELRHSSKDEVGPNEGGEYVEDLGAKKSSDGSLQETGAKAEGEQHPHTKGKKNHKAGNERREMVTARWASIRFKEDPNRERVFSDDSSVVNSPSPGADPAQLSPNAAPDQTQTRDTSKGSIPRSSASNMKGLDRTRSGSLRIKDLLERWDEPVTKFDKPTGNSIADILKFRKALTYMDLRHPFSVAFGPASTRDECIESAQGLYNKLLDLSPYHDVVTFDVLKALALDAEGKENPSKVRSLKKLFRPDRHNDITLLAFVQSCDNVYKKLRFFRASVGNSSVIDKVLENIFGFFYFLLLGIIILSFLKLNPWPVLLSMSTLLVTFAFAVGSSASKAIEGILLITGQRPFDIGDRCVFGGDVSMSNSVIEYWFVEDISLFTTTLRYAATNEVATVSNSAIAARRVTNCQRSPNALVYISFAFNIKLKEPEMEEKFRKSLEDLVASNPRTWASTCWFRLDKLYSNVDLAIYSIGLRARCCWQDIPTILDGKADMMKHCHDTAVKLGILYRAPIPRQIILSEDQPSQGLQSNNQGGFPPRSGQQQANAQTGAQNIYLPDVLPPMPYQDAPLRRTNADNEFLQHLQQANL